MLVPIILLLAKSPTSKIINMKGEKNKATVGGNEMTKASSDIGGNIEEQFEYYVEHYMKELGDTSYDEANELSKNRWNSIREEYYRQGGNWEEGPFEPSALADACYWDAEVALAEIRECGIHNGSIAGILSSYYAYRYYKVLYQIYKLKDYISLPMLDELPIHPNAVEKLIGSSPRVIELINRFSKYFEGDERPYESGNLHRS